MTLLDLLKPFDINNMQRVRLGKQSDGGYIVPMEMIKDFTHCITYGVNDDISFEQDLSLKNGKIRFNLYDGTIKKQPAQLSNSEFFFKNISIDGLNDTITPHQTIQNILNVFPNAQILLKCDIEGYEYGSLQTLSPEDISHIKCLVLEVHWIIRRYIKECAWLLSFLSNSFSVFHVHGNTHGPADIFIDKNKNRIIIPEVYEITYINNSLITDKNPYCGPLPIPDIDFSNNPRIKDYDLSFLK